MILKSETVDQDSTNKNDQIIHVLMSNLALDKSVVSVPLALLCFHALGEMWVPRKCPQAVYCLEACNITFSMAPRTFEEFFFLYDCGCGDFVLDLYVELK